ncbi:MAG: alkaline phosphatase family protein [Isosphaeraceae bacterium]|nr:alkaline phosphatase family protein [Isosphaeraceae bacterium]
MIGLDGFEPSIVKPMLEAGELPNLAKLRTRGGFSTVATTNPAQTPVAWSTFATGVNPGAHGIFDFLRRDPGTYLPDIGLNRYEQKNAFLPPKVVNLRRGVPVWQRLTEAGIGSTIVRCPCSYPPDPLKGRLLSGLGVPDIRGGFGSATFYTSDSGATPREGENLVTVRRDGQTVSTYLIGPRHPKTRADCRVEVTLRVDPAAGTVSLRSDGSPQELVIRQGEWSDWLRVKFKLGLLQSVLGMVRFHLVGTEPELALYASPVNFDPEFPLFPISSPASYAGELLEQIGPYATTGMVEDHTGLNNGRFGEEAYLAQCAEVWDERAAMMRLELERFDSGLFFCLFDTPDRVQHMLWRFREPDHPANRDEPLRPGLERAIEDQYRQGDAIVGEALGHADDQTLVVVLSDHGFQSFQRGLHLNNWLLDNGLLALRGGVRPGDEAGDMLRNVDWGRTQAYALGLGGIYLNMKSRERDGVVAPDEAEGLKTAIVKGLTGLTDHERGTLAVRSVVTREQAYSGPFATEAPDLVVNCNAGYRLSWETGLGGVPDRLFDDNRKRWGGDHIIDPALVPGVLFMNRPFRGAAARLLDLAPTILDALGAPKDPGMEGSSLLS